MSVLPETSQSRLSFQESLTRHRPWTYYYSHASHRRVGDMIEVRRWCTYHDDKDVLVGSYSYAHTICKYDEATQFALDDGEIKVYPNAYKFTSA